LPIRLDFRGLAEGHRSLSERGIITTNPGPSTLYFDAVKTRPPGCSRSSATNWKSLFFTGKRCFFVRARRLAAGSIPVPKQIIAPIPGNKCADCYDLTLRFAGGWTGRHWQAGELFASSTRYSCLRNQFAPFSAVSGELDPGKFSLANLVYMRTAGRYLLAAIFQPLAINTYGTLLDHAKGIRCAGNQASLL